MDGTDNGDGLKVVAVLTHFKRPANVPHIVKALRAQSRAPDEIVIVDNHPQEDREDKSFAVRAPDYYQIPCQVPAEYGADDVVRMFQNAGPPCRWAALIGRWDADYFYFCDDDLLPGANCLQFLLDTAKSVENEFATIGQKGRVYHRRRRGVWRYRSKNVPATNRAVPVDMTARAHLVRGDLLYHALGFACELARKYGDSPWTVKVHDDIVLCQGIQRAKGWPSYITPLGPDASTKINSQELSTRDANGAKVAVCGRSSHMEERSQLIRMCENLGWRQVSQEFAA